MKSFYTLPAVLFAVLAGAGSLQAQNAQSPDSTGLPGDHFSLPGALELFKKAGSPEAFEQLLNTEAGKVNNLDLNGDGNTDYIRVINKKDNNVHVFILQALVSANESQDIAVIELEKTGPNNAVVQITGDEDIYGEEVIVEPGEDTDNAFLVPGAETAHGPNTTYEYGPVNGSTGIIVNVWAWPCVRFVFAPSYTVWVSPWAWGRRPAWWHPWKPVHWHVYRPVHINYYRHYAVVKTHRVAYAQKIYRPVRVTSVTVRTRNQAAVSNYRVHRTMQRRTVTTANGNQYRVNRKTTSVNSRHGKASRNITTIRKKRR